MCILIVEDELLIRLLLVEELEAGGFEVRVAEDGDRAAALIEDSGTDFTMLVTDVHMPGRLNGLGVAQLMHAQRPEVPVVYTTGRPDALHGAARLGANEALVEKPFSPSELLVVIRRLLSGRFGGREH
jgi:DNA-binding response OmpR family regulator